MSDIKPGTLMEYVDTLDKATICDILIAYDDYARNGIATLPSPLLYHALQFVVLTGRDCSRAVTPDSEMARLMGDLAFRCARNFSTRYIESIK
jgi:hypothetical protein